MYTYRNPCYSLHTCTNSSFIQAISIAPLQVHYYSEALAHYTVSEFHAEAPWATASEGLAQGTYVAARAGFQPATLRTKGDESTNEPPRPGPIKVCIAYTYTYMHAYTLESLHVYSCINFSIAGCPFLVPFVSI